MSNRRFAPKEKAPSGARASVIRFVAGPTPPRWTCHHHAQGSDIEAYVATLDGLEVIAQTKTMDGADARTNAELIVQAVNEYETLRPLIAELVSLLKLYPESSGVAGGVRQDIETVCRKARRILRM